MKQKTLAKQYVVLYCGVVLCGILVIAFFTRSVDPYGFFIDPLENREVNDRPKLIHTVRMNKPYQVQRLEPDVILLGSSKTGRINPVHPEWAENTPYNLAVPGASLYEIQRFLQHANAVQPIKTLLLEVNYRSFLLRANKTSNGFLEKRMKVNADDSYNKDYLMTVLKDYISSLYSFDSLGAALDEKNFRKTIISYNTKGGWDYAKRLPDDHKKFFTAMQNILTRQKDRRTLPTLSFAAYRKILSVAYNAGIKTKVFIPPTHGLMRENTVLLGWQAQYDTWKRLLVKINKEEADKAGEEPFEVLDFDGFTLITAEPIPNAQQKTKKMKWNWEGIHFTRLAGKLILDRLLTPESKLKQGVLSLANSINTSNIEAHLLKMDQQYQKYNKINSVDIEKLRNIASGMGYDKNKLLGKDSSGSRQPVSGAIPAH